MVDNETIVRTVVGLVYAPMAGCTTGARIAMVLVFAPTADSKLNVRTVVEDLYVSTETFDVVALIAPTLYVK